MKLNKTSNITVFYFLILKVYSRKFLFAIIIDLNSLLCKQFYMKEISFKEFQKLDLRVGKVLAAEEVKDSRSLIRMDVDFGTEKRQVVAGLKQWYKAEDLIGNKYMFICNLERKKFMGLESQAMIFAADDEKGNIVLMTPEKDVEIGSRIR